MNKRTLREGMHHKRKNLSKSEIQRKSEEIFHQLYQLPIYQDASSIMCYVSIGTEVYTHGFIEQALGENKKIVVPVTKPDTKELLCSQIIDFNKDLIIGHWGLFEPKKEALRIVPSSEVDLILVPGLAYTSQGYRLGYGGGYYDRFLSTIDNTPPTIGLCFELQIVEKLPIEGFDIPMDFILTEKRLIQTTHEE